MSDDIEIVGACTNNLKSVNTTLLSRKATMVVGVSGSGKSSLLADTLAIEANSRMRRFLDVNQPHLHDNDVPAFLGPLPPSIHFAQSAFRASKRTTVGTSSGLLMLLRRYFVRDSTPWSDEIKSHIPPPSSSSYATWIEQHYAGALSVWTVVVRWQYSDGKHAVNKLRNHGIKVATVRKETDSATRQDQGRKIDVEKFKPFSANARCLIEAEVGHAQVSGKCPELTTLLEHAFSIGGDVIVDFSQGESLPKQLKTERGTQLDSALHWVHPKIQEPFFVPSDALLSFNSPSNPRSGACTACNGIGKRRTVDAGVLMPHPEKGMHDGCCLLWTKKNYRYVNIQHDTIEGLRGVHGFSPDIPWQNLSQEAKDLILFGSDDPIADVDRHTHRKVSAPRKFPGFLPEILRRAEGKKPAKILTDLITEGQCPECKGTRWSREARALRLGKWHVHQILGIPFDNLKQITKPGGSMAKGLPRSSRSLVTNLHTSACAFVEAGLGHISGERGMTTLSDGESRRSRLAMLLHTPGEGLALLLDEPARGLHEEDVARLSCALAKLKQRHTLVISEHRTSLAKIADELIQIGPGAGENGGQIVYQGPPKQLASNSSQKSSARTHLPVNPKTTRLTVAGANIHTLSSVSCSIPLGRLVSITGVSGSGKSCFIRGILVPALAEKLSGPVDADDFAWPGGTWNEIGGFERISSVLALEAKTPGENRRSTLATYLKLADDLRNNFGHTSKARRLGLQPADFGWNSGQGRCQNCLGLGELEDTGGWFTCPSCGGSRFGAQVLSIRLNGQSIADILNLPLTELLYHPLANEAGWQPLLKQLIALDLGYLTLGRRLDRISGGEHQRLRIAHTLSNSTPEGLLLILDEPSAGLHPKDAQRLLKVLDHIVANGANTVLLVEHNPTLIQASDWIIDFGPGGGPEGGKIVGKGPPGKIAKLDMPTGRILAGKRIRFPPHRKAVARASQIPAVESSEAQYRNAHQWLKRLIGENVSVEEMDQADLRGLAIPFNASTEVARPHEIGGLDIEVARLLLDAEDDLQSDFANLCKLWSRHPEAQLQIPPFLEEIRIWGYRIPASVKKDAQNRIQHMGLECITESQNGNDFFSARATGKRFQALDGTSGERLQCVRDAFAVSGGFVELSDSKQRLLGIIQKRRIDLTSPIPAVAPLLLSSASLSRFHAAGCCPCCKGSGAVTGVDEKLLIANSESDPLEVCFLRSEVLDVFKGVRRNNMQPFFKRMNAEGLWPSGRPYSHLSLEEKTILMHGFWSRPSHGSFIKTSKVNPEDVRSWLRWDGLIPAVLAESKRSKKADWRNKLESSSKPINCPECLGTGLQLHSRTVMLGQRSLFEWVRKGTIEEFTEALREMNPASQRMKRRKQRILYCLQPLSKKLPQAPLRKSINDIDLLCRVYGRIVDKMTSLKLLN